MLEVRNILWRLKSPLIWLFRLPKMPVFFMPWRYVHPRSVHVVLRPKRSSPMDRHLAPPISGSWSPGAARAVDGASLLHGPLRVDRTAGRKKNWTGGRTVGGRNIKAPFFSPLTKLPVAKKLDLFREMWYCRNSNLGRHHVSLLCYQWKFMYKYVSQLWSTVL